MVQALSGIAEQGKTSNREYTVLRAAVVLYLENLISKRLERYARFSDADFDGYLNGQERALYELAKGSSCNSSSLPL